VVSLEEDAPYLYPYLFYYGFQESIATVSRFLPLLPGSNRFQPVAHQTRKAAITPTLTQISRSGG